MDSSHTRYWANSFRNTHFNKDVFRNKEKIKRIKISTRLCGSNPHRKSQSQRMV